MSKILIFSTPAPIPHSIYPDVILAANIAIASIPELQNLLIVVTGTENGIPAKS